MKKIILRIIGNILALYLTSQFIPGFMIENTLYTLFIAALVLLVINTFIKPLVKLLLLPINLLTLGFFQWVTNVIILYIFDLISSQVTITAFDFSGLSTGLINLPPTHISLFWALVISSFSISLIETLYSWLVNE